MKEGSEKEILNSFVRKGRLKGLYVTDVPIGSYYPKKIDCVCIEMSNEDLEIHTDWKNPTEYIQNSKLGFEQFKNRTVWLLEVKQKLNPSALGQILMYKYHFERTYFDTILKGVGIVCEESDSMIKEVCQEYNVVIFQV